MFLIRDLPDFDAYTGDVYIRWTRALLAYEIYFLNLRVVPGPPVPSEAPPVKMLSSILWWSIQSPCLLPGTVTVRPKSTALTGHTNYRS